MKNNKGEVWQPVVIIIAIIALIVLFLFLMNSGDRYANMKTFGQYFTEIDDNKYYNNETRIVYIIGRESHGYGGFGYMAPYYSSNGKLCIYDINENKIIEVGEQT